MAERKKTSAYLRATRARKSYCSGRGKKTTLTKAVTAYKKDAEKKGKPKADIERVAKKLLTTCSSSAGAAKKSTTRKKTATTRKRTTTRKKAS